MVTDEPACDKASADRQERFELLSNQIATETQWLFLSLCLLNTLTPDYSPNDTRETLLSPFDGGADLLKIQLLCVPACRQAGKFLYSHYPDGDESLEQ